MDIYDTYRHFCDPFNTVNTPLTPPLSPSPSGLIFTTFKLEPAGYEHTFTINPEVSIWPYVWHFLLIHNVSLSPVMQMEIEVNGRTRRNVVVDLMSQQPVMSFMELGVDDGSQLIIRDVGPVKGYVGWKEVKRGKTEDEGRIHWEESMNEVMTIEGAHDAIVISAGDSDAEIEQEEITWNITIDAQQDYSLSKLMKQREYRIRALIGGSYHCDFQDGNYKTALWVQMMNHFTEHQTEGGFFCPHRNCTFYGPTVTNYEEHIRTIHSRHRIPRTQLTPKDKGRTIEEAEDFTNNAV